MLTLTLTLTLSERNALLWRPVNYSLANAIFSNSSTLPNPNPLICCYV